MTADKQDSVYSWFTGMIGQVVGMIVTESILTGLAMALAGGFLGYLGKELAARVVKRLFDKSEQKKEK
jgi:cell division protein FtsB